MVSEPALRVILPVDKQVITFGKGVGFFSRIFYKIMLKFGLEEMLYKRLESPQNLCFFPKSKAVQTKQHPLTVISTVEET